MAVPCPRSREQGGRRGKFPSPGGDRRRSLWSSSTLSQRAEPALAVVAAVAAATGSALDAAGSTTLLGDVAGFAAFALNACEGCAIVARRAPQPVGAAVAAVALATRAAAAVTRAGRTLAVAVTAADAGVGAFDAAVGTTFVAEVAWRAARTAHACLVPSTVRVRDAPLPINGPGKGAQAEAHQYRQRRADNKSGAAPDGGRAEQGGGLHKPVEPCCADSRCDRTQELKRLMSKEQGASISCRGCSYLASAASTR